MRPLFVAASFVVAVIAAFYAGTRVGAEQQLIGSAQYRMMSHYGYIKQLSNNSVSDAISLANTNMDQELITHMDWVNSKWRWLFPNNIVPGDKYARAAAQYRLSHPNNEPQHAAEFKVELNNALLYYRGAPE